MCRTIPEIEDFEEVIEELKYFVIQLHMEGAPEQWSLDNKNGKVCDTYPEILLVPSRIPNDSLLRCSKFRSRNRMPALTYAY